MTPKPLCQEEALDLLSRWEEVVRVSALELSAAPPRSRHAWALAKARAESVVAVLEVAVAAEREANRAWREARAADRRGAPVLRLVE